MAGKKIRFVQVAVADAPARKGRRLSSHLVALDSRGRLFERFSDMPSGVWGEIEAPDEPEKRPRRR